MAGSRRSDRSFSNSERVAAAMSPTLTAYGTSKGLDCWALTTCAATKLTAARVVAMCAFLILRLLEWVRVPKHLNAILCQIDALGRFCGIEGRICDMPPKHGGRTVHDSVCRISALPCRKNALLRHKYSNEIHSRRFSVAKRKTRGHLNGCRFLH